MPKRSLLPHLSVRRDAAGRSRGVVAGHTTRHGSGERITARRLPVSIGVFYLCFPSQNIDELLGVVQDIYILQLEFVIYHHGSESEHFNQFSLALVTFVSSRKFSPMTPSEGYLGWSREHI
jgi:hypothetical protein